MVRPGANRRGRGNPRPVRAHAARPLRPESLRGHRRGPALHPTLDTRRGRAGQDSRKHRRPVPRHRPPEPRAVHRTQQASRRRHLAAWRARTSRRSTCCWRESPRAPLIRVHPRTRPRGEGRVIGALPVEVPIEPNPRRILPMKRVLLPPSPSWPSAPRPWSARRHRRSGRHGLRVRGARRPGRCPRWRLLGRRLRRTRRRGGLDTAEPALTFEFGDTAGPLDVPAGAYDVFVYPAGATPAADGSDAVLDLTTPDLPAGATAAIVAHLNEAGDGGHPHAVRARRDRPRPASPGPGLPHRRRPRGGRGAGRRHPAVPGPRERRHGPAAATQDPVEVPAGTYGLQVATPDDSLVVPLGDFDLAAGSAYFAFAIGRVSGETFEVVPLVSRSAKARRPPRRPRRPRPGGCAAALHRLTAAPSARCPAPSPGPGPVARASGRPVQRMEG